MEEATEVDGSVCLKIGFGFNNPTFSDRILRIQLTRDPSDSKSEGSEECRVTTVHINSLILASQSAFFCKMFSNGMRESEQQAVALTVHASEELALLDLLQFMYGSVLNANTSADLLKVLILADRFHVITCIAHCARRLSELSMTFELAASCINLPSSVLEGGNTQLKSLIDKASCFISKNFVWHIGAARKLPLETIQKLMSWDALEVKCEDEVYDFLISWATTNYEDVSERCQVFSSQLFPLVRLPYMSFDKIKSVPQCELLEPCDATTRVIEALQSKYVNHQSNDVATCLARERAYKVKPVQVTVLDDSPYPECIVHSKLKKAECTILAEGFARIRTQDFHVGDESFCLEFCRVLRNFGIFLQRCPYKSITDAQKLDYDIAVRLKTNGKFTAVETGTTTLLSGDCRCFMIQQLWDEFMADDSQFFIDGVLYVRVALTLQQ